MADLEAAAWSETAANNIAPSPDGWPPNSSPNIVYTTDREMMGAIKRDWNRRNATVASGGSANAQTLSFTVNPTAYVHGQRYAFIAGFANTGPMTLAIGALAPVNVINMSGGSLGGGELKVGLISEVIYDGTYFQLIAGSGAGAGVYLPLIGGTLTGSIAITPASGGATINLNAIAGQQPSYTLSVAGQAGWSMFEAATNGTFNIFTSAAGGTCLSIAPATGAVAIKGDTSGGNAAAGYVGEMLSTVVTSPGGTLTSGTTLAIGGFNLTAGDWDVHGEAWIAIGTGAATSLNAGISTVSGSLTGAPGLASSRVSLLMTFTASNTHILALNTCRMSVAATTGIYLNVMAVFPSGTSTAYGVMTARRIR